MSGKTEVLGRLAARDVNSLAGQSTAESDRADREATVHRLIKELHIPIMSAGPTMVKMVKFLQDSDLTINFTVFKFFNKVPSGKTYDNQFGSGQKWGDASYLKTRDEAEEAMFDFANVKRGGGNVVPQPVLARIKKFGQFDTNPVDFEAISRPKYAALNFTRDANGAASQWGKSFFVLKTYIKHNCTFVETDSFAFLGKASATAQNHVATFTDMIRLVRYINPNMLEALYNAMRGLPTTGFHYGGTNYIESHLHGEIKFSRDIEKIVVSKAELSDSALKSAATTFPKYLKQVDEKTVRKNIDTFATKHGITVDYID
jgi:hypothetical protein